MNPIAGVDGTVSCLEGVVEFVVQRAVGQFTWLDVEAALCVRGSVSTWRHRRVEIGARELDYRECVGVDLDAKGG